MPPQWLVPMLQKMMKEEEEAFWHRLDVETGQELDLSPLPPNVQLEEAGWQVLWGLELELVQEGPPLSPLVLGPMEVDGAKQAPEDGAMSEEDAVGD